MQLLQDTGNPWSHFVVCILLNRSTASSVSRVLPALFAHYPRPVTMARSRVGGDLERIIYSCGLSNVKADRLRKMSREFPAWMESGDAPEKLPGVGRYGADSYRILFLGEHPENVADHALKFYMEGL
jgi:endonuclease III